MSKNDLNREALEEVWNQWRDEMPVANNWAYFDHAAVGPITKAAAETLTDFAATASNHGDVHWLDWSAKVNSVRKITAELVNCQPSEVTLVPNTTTGINLVAEGFPWQSGDNIVVPEGEFPSNLFPWLNQESKGVEVRIVPRRDGRVEVSDLLEQMDENTKIVAVSWVGYASGFRIDIQKLVRESHNRGVLVFLDAIQGLGIYPLDLTDCDVDFLAADGHKWLLGPEGAGITIIRKRHLDLLRTSVVGWASVKNSHKFSGASFELRDDAARYECGSANMSGLMALAASMQMFLDVQKQHGRDAIGHRVLEQAENLRQKLTAAGAILLHPNEPRSIHGSGIVTFEVPGVDPSDFRNEAMQGGLVVSCRGGGIRASVHVYNDDSDLQRLADCVRRCSPKNLQPN